MIKYKITNTDGDAAGLIVLSDGWPVLWFATDGATDWHGRAPTRMIAMTIAVRRVSHRSRAWALRSYVEAVADGVWQILKEYHRGNQKMFELPADADFRTRKVGP